jgi:hypothetical protein
MPYDMETNLAIINYATKKTLDHPYPFLFIDLEKRKFYKTFETEIKVKDIYDEDSETDDDDREKDKENKSEMGE